MRFYLRYTEASCTIVDRATHDVLGFLEVKEKEKAIRTLKTLSNLSLEEYIVYCMNLGIKFRIDKNTKEFIFDKDSEDWATKAWIATTNKALKELDAVGIIPDDRITVELVNEIKSHKPIKSTIEAIASTQQPTSTVLDAEAKEEDIEAPGPTKEVDAGVNKKDKDVNTNKDIAINKPKKLAKKPKTIDDKSILEEDEKPNKGDIKPKKPISKKKLIKKDRDASSKANIEKPKYTKDILRNLLATKKIDVKTFREEMKKLS